jgi:hypothetical protein
MCTTIGLEATRLARSAVSLAWESLVQTRFALIAAGLANLVDVLASNARLTPCLRRLRRDVTSFAVQARILAKHSLETASCARGASVTAEGGLEATSSALFAARLPSGILEEAAPALLAAGSEGVVVEPTRNARLAFGKPLHVAEEAYLARFAACCAEERL